jgi:predicted amino acid racemase
MSTPYVSIDIQKIEHNARTIVGLCQEQGIAVSGVTKVTCGHPEVARAMLRGGVSSVADSRWQNIQRLRDAGIDTTFMLLRVPALSEVAKVIAWVDVSLNSELTVLEALSREAQQRGRVHDVILMVDLGDLREGMWPDELLPLTQQVLKLPGIRLKGLGTNLACFAGVMPSADNMQQLVTLADEMERRFDLSVQWISGMNSSGLELLASGNMPQRVNHARLGESLLLGRETTRRNPWPDTFQDAFVLHAEIVELKQKPSLPVGQCTQDAFGQRPRFEDRGMIVHALLNVGRGDIDLDGITPCDPKIRIIGASSGYLVLDVTATSSQIHVGDELAFIPNYSALLRIMNSAYVEKRTLYRDAQ